MLNKQKYFIGLSDKIGEYNLYYIYKHKKIFIAKYDNPQTIINDLNKYELLGTSDKLGQEIYHQLILYIDGILDIEEFIKSILVIFKFTDSIEFQRLLFILDLLKKNNIIETNPLFRFRGNCDKLSEQYDLEIFTIFLNLYDLINVKYNRFKYSGKYINNSHSDQIGNFISEVMYLVHYIPDETQILSE